MDWELFEIYERNFPFNIRKKETVLQILRNKDNVCLERRDKQYQLIGVSVINQNTVLLLCVDGAHRNQGIGTDLLNKSEQLIKEHGYDQIVIGNGFDYLMPGVPTARRYVPAENEKLYENMDEEASNFFTKRGYVHSWECNCFDMRVPFEGQVKVEDGVSTSINTRTESGQTSEGYRIGDIVSGITYRWAKLEDLSGICQCTEDACPEFTKYYREEGLYSENSDEKVLIAVADGEVAGTLIVGIEDGDKQIGSVGCTTVRRIWQGRHIAVNLVSIGTKYLQDIGMKEAFLGYTYTGLDHLYGYAGYKICVYYMMAVKALG